MYYTEQAHNDVRRQLRLLQSLKTHKSEDSPVSVGTFLLFCVGAAGIAYFLGYLTGLII